MAVEYVLVKKVNPQHDNQKEFFYAQAVSKGIITGDRIAEEIQQRCSLTAGDCKNVWDNMAQLIAAYLNSGHSVEIPHLGTFYVVVKSEPIEHIDGNVREKVRTVGPKFRPCKELSKSLFTPILRKKGDTHKVVKVILKKKERLEYLTAYLKANQHVRRAEYQYAMGISEPTARKDLRTLIQKKQIKSEGKGPFTYYTLIS